MTTTALMDHNVDFQKLHRRILADYTEMPGLMLTYEQAVRLWACHPVVCRAVLEALVESRFLVRNRRAAFMRRG
jgi:hypothetical protein